MSTHSQDEYVLPRPVSKLPEYPNARARTNAAEKLVERCGLSTEAAAAIADACIDPADLRVALEHPERLRVPGGILLGVRTTLWSRKVLPDPRNPRIGPARRHPFAVDPGTDEESRFAPIADPTSNGAIPELHVAIESREHLTWASTQAKLHILETNDWRTSIRNHGVMTEVWVVATRYAHEDGSPDLWAITTAEGSSRVTALHDIVDVRSVDSVHESADRQMRTLIRQLNDALDRGPNKKQLEALRCECVPALVLVGFEPHAGGTDEFSTAVKSLVALRHVDPPQPWGEGPENESLADACLAELERKRLITPILRRYLAGSLTRREAETAHLSSDPCVRAAYIVATFSGSDPAKRSAIRAAVTSQSTRKKISPLLLTRLAAALIVRGYGGEGRNAERVRKYMQTAFAESVREGEWKPTTRPATDLVRAALSEHAGDANPDESSLGADRLELAARAAYALIATLSLWADTGTRSDQPDRRTPGQVIDRMVRSQQGIHQLGRALEDYAAAAPIRVVDDEGEIVRTVDGAQERQVADSYLREQFPPPGQPRAPRAPRTGREHLQVAVAEFAQAINTLAQAKTEIEAVTGVDGSPLVERYGVEPVHTGEWQRALQQMAFDVNAWGRTFASRHKAAGMGAERHDSDAEVSAEAEDDAADDEEVA